MHWLDLLIGGGSGTAIVTALRGGFIRLAKRVVHDVVADVTKDVTSELAKDVGSLKVKLAAETGGNSNGLRQKLNEVGENVANLAGAFDQHVTEQAHRRPRPY